MAQSHPRSHWLRNLGIGILVLLIAYALAGFLLLPWWLERALPEQLQQRMGWHTEVSGIRVNPFTLSVESTGLSALDGEDEKVLGFDRLLLDLNLFDLVRGILGFRSIELAEPYIRLDLLQDQSVNFARDWQAHNPPEEQPDSAGEKASLPRFYFGQIRVTGGELLFRDYTQPAPAQFHITPLDLSLDDFATWSRSGDDSQYRIQAAIGSQTLAWDGVLSVAPLYSKGSLDISGVDQETLSHFLGPYLPYELRGGRVDLRTEYELQVDDSLFLTTRNGSLQLNGLALAVSGDQEDASLITDSIRIDRIGFDLGRRNLELGTVVIENPDITLIRDKAGTIDWLRPLSESGTPEEDKGSADSSAALHWSVAGVSLDKGRVHWQDQQPETTADLALEQLSLELGSMTDQLQDPVTYTVRTALASGGRLSMTGQVTPAPFTLEMALSGADIALAAFEPYLQSGANLSVVTGRLAVDGDLDLDGQKEVLTGTFSGTAGIEALALRLPGDKNQLVSWKSLQLAPVEYNVSPARLEIGTVTLTRPVMNLVRGTDSLYNLERVLRTGPETAPSAEPEADGTPSVIFRIGQLLLENGALSFTDRTMEPVFSTDLDELSGTLTGLSNIPPQEGEISMGGRVGGVGKLDLKGTVGALGSEDTSDLKLTMKDVSLPVLSPYFGRYIGYGVDSGKLNLSLDYQLTGTRLEASNLVILDRLELGQPVASEEAVKAPVKLGLALLRDSDGIIEVDLPVSGDLADPEFRVGKVVMRAFVNLLVKAATSPFSVLGSIADLAGLTGEELGQIGFVPGTAELASGEDAKLRALAGALQKRPDLVLSIRGGVAPEVDGPALADTSTSGSPEPAQEDFDRLARARGLIIRNWLQERQGIASDQLFLADPSRSARLSDQGEVMVGLSLDVR